MADPQCTSTPNLPQEEWRPVVGYVGLYEVSNHGRVKRVAAQRGTRVGYILKGGLSAYGYPEVKLRDSRGLRTLTVHRLVAEAFLVPVDSALQVNHIDANRANNVVSNLEWVTPRQNSEHMVALGRSMRGRCPTSTLSEQDVRGIRALRESGATFAAIAGAYGISVQSASDISKRRSWKHVA